MKGITNATSTLDREFYTPVLEQEPSIDTTHYIDPITGQLTQFKLGQCCTYYNEGKWSISIAIHIEVDFQGNIMGITWQKIGIDEPSIGKQEIYSIFGLTV